MSHLKHFAVGNFKVFKELTHFNLAPITILTGKNNSGKSSLIKSLLVLRNSTVDVKNIYRGYDFEQWKFDRSELKLGSPDEVFNNEQKSKRITFELSLNIPMLPNGIISLVYSIEDNDETFNLVAFKIINNGESIVEFEKNLDNLNSFKDLKTQFIKIDFQYFINQIKEFVSDSSSKIDCQEIGKKTGLYKFPNRISDKPVLELIELLKSHLVILKVDNNDIHSEIIDSKREKVDISNENLINVQNQIFDMYKNGFILNDALGWMSCINSFYLNALNLNDKILEIFNQDEFLVKNTSTPYREKMHYYTFQGKTLFIEPDLQSFFDYINTFILKIFDELQEECQNITYLPSIRARNERLYQVSKEGYAIQEIDQKAFEGIDFTNTVINQFYLDALKDFEIGDDIEIKTIQRTATEITIIRNGRRMLLSDLGFGYAQILPIFFNILIIATNYNLWRSTKKSNGTSDHCPIILIEEPESNLHPDFQSKLADLFIKATNLFGIQFIIETHSEYLIRRLQYLTAKTDIKPEDISIYYFNNPEKIPHGEKQIFKIEIRPDGIFKQDFGSGFYDQAANSTFDLFRLIGDN